MDKFNQTAPGIVDDIKGCFRKHNLSELWDKLIYLSAETASVNSGKGSGLTAQIQAEHGWVLFVWSFSHRNKFDGQIADALISSPSKIIQRVVRAEVFVQEIKGDL